MELWQLALLALIQGAAELLPVSSSAHVIMAQKLMGLDPGAPAMTFLLVMLHTGTMFAVLVTFWGRWKSYLVGAPLLTNPFLRTVILATAVTGFLGLGLKFLIERVILEGVFGHAHGEIEHLFRNLPMIGFFLAVAGTLILYSGLKTRGKILNAPIDSKRAFWIGAIQGLCLPFRGFSRSGATISTSLLLGVDRLKAEDFSFALAVAVTPPVIVLQVRRLLKAYAAGELEGAQSLGQAFLPGLLGMGLAFVSGFIALKLLARVLESQRWHLFGYYCYVAALLTLSVNALTSS